MTRPTDKQWPRVFYSGGPGDQIQRGASLRIFLDTSTVVHTSDDLCILTWEAHEEFCDFFLRQTETWTCLRGPCCCLALTARRGTEAAAEEGASAHVHPCIHASIVLQPCAEIWRSVWNSSWCSWSHGPGGLAWLTVRNLQWEESTPQQAWPAGRGLTGKVSWTTSWTGLTSAFCPCSAGTEGFGGNYEGTAACVKMQFIYEALNHSSGVGVPFWPHYGTKV